MGVKESRRLADLLVDDCSTSWEVGEWGRETMVVRVMGETAGLL